MPKSEIAHIREQIRLEYEAAQRGLKGLASGVARHDFIIARTENIGETFAQLTQVVGTPETAMGMLNERLEALPETPTRFHLVDFLGRTLGDTEETARLIDYIQDMWETIDLLRAWFGSEQAQRIIDTPANRV